MSILDLMGLRIHVNWVFTWPALRNRNSSRAVPVTEAPGSQRSPGLRQPVSDDSATMKTSLLMSTANSSGGMASHPQPACNAENLPAYFKQGNKTVKAPVTLTSSPTPKPQSSSNGNSTAAAGQPFVLVPGSPPPSSRSVHDEDNTEQSAPPSRLAKLRLSNLARKREQMKTMKMPELSESGEADNETANINGSLKSSSSRSPRRGVTAMPPPEISVTSDEEDSSSKASGDELVRPPSPSDDPVTPSIPDSFLQQLGLSTEGKEINGDGGVDQLPDKQLESRFNSLALAFKTDRLTLEKRLGIQERSRDIAEQNIEKELQGLRDAVETLNRLCSDEQVQDVVAKICHHLDILEHSMARVSSRAEVFGAVQQEKRMCLAMEVMITFTENTRRLREKEQSDVEEARKVLSERSQSSSTLGLDFGGIGGRSASVCAGFNNPRTTRRRSEVALPRFFGGSGSPSLHVSSSMEPRQRFQAATANVTVRNSITSSLRRASLERQKKQSVQSSSSSSGQSRNNSIEKSDKTDSVKKQSSQEEEAFKLGYEEGLKANISREMNDLRDQQTTVSSNVEQVMDRIETLQQEDTQDAELEETVSKVKDIIVQVRQWMSNPNWQSASHTLRRIAAGVIFLVAMIIVILTFAPLVPGNITMRNHGKPAQ